MVKINNKPFGTEYFDNKEVIFKDVGIEAPVIIQLYWEDTRDLATLDMAVEYIREKLGEDTDITLNIPYLPYSGMDREINEQLFSLKHIANILNRMRFTKVIVRDPHNKGLTAELLNNVVFESIQPYINKVIKQVKPDIIFFPDKGAVKKYTVDIDTHGIPIMHGHKGRGLKDRGHISSYDLDNHGIDITGNKILIIDDICRKGGTFMGASNKLKEIGASSVHLYVTHCEVSIFKGKLLTSESPIDSIWTTDSEVGAQEFQELDNTDKHDMFHVVTL